MNERKKRLFAKILVIVISAAMVLSTILWSVQLAI